MLLSSGVFVSSFIDKQKNFPRSYTEHASSDNKFGITVCVAAVKPDFLNRDRNGLLCQRAATVFFIR